MKKYVLQWSFFLVGLIVLGCGIAMTFKGASYGVGAWDVLHYGLFTKFGLTVGSWSIIIGSLIILSTWLVTKEAPKIGAYVNMLTVGLFIDFFIWLLPSTDSFLAESFYYFGGVLVMGTGIGLYVSGQVGAGPRDHLMLFLSQKMGWSVTKTRGLMEICVLVAGYALGGPVGVGTFIIAFGLGPCIQLSLHVSKRCFSYMENKIQTSSINDAPNSSF